MESSNRFSDCVLLTPWYPRSQICSLHVSPTIAVWQSEVLEILRIWFWVFGSSRCPFLAMLGWRSNVYLITLLVSMYLASGERGRHTQDKSYNYGAYRSKNLQHGASAGRPGAVGCLGRRRTGGRPWPGHGGHGPHSSHDWLMVKETCRLCSPAVGAVLRRCKALAMRRYFYGLSQLRRSGGPWFFLFTGATKRHYAIMDGPAFPQVIEPDFSTALQKPPQQKECCRDATTGAKDAKMQKTGPSYDQTIQDCQCAVVLETRRCRSSRNRRNREGHSGAVR